MSGSYILTCGDLPNVHDDLVFLDVEASGLGVKTYPIQVGWANMGLQAWDHLIRPTEKWLTRFDWQIEAEEIHGLDQADLDRYGHDPRSVALAVNNALADRYVVSDAQSFDQAWLDVLYLAADVTPSFRLYSWEDLILKLSNDEPGRLMRIIHEEMPRAQNLVEADGRFAHTHRAGEDALHAAAIWRVIFGLPLPSLGDVRISPCSLS